MIAEWAMVLITLFVVWCDLYMARTYPGVAGSNLTGGQGWFIPRGLLLTIVYLINLYRLQYDNKVYILLLFHINY